MHRQAETEQTMQHLQLLVRVLLDVRCLVVLLKNRRFEMDSKEKILFDSIRQALELFILGEDNEKVFNSFLDTMVKSTDSLFGFLDEVLYYEDGTQYKRSLSLSNISWDEGSLKLYENLKRNNLEFRNLNNLACWHNGTLVWLLIWIVAVIPASN